MELKEIAEVIEDFKKTSLKRIDEKIDEKAKNLFTEEDRKLLNDTATKVKSIKDWTDKPSGGRSFVQALDEAMDKGTVRDDLAKMAAKENGYKKNISIELKAVGDVSVINNYSGGSRMLQVAAPGIIQTPPRKVHIRDIVPGGTIGQGTEFVFMKENGDGEGAISPIAEGWTKAQIDVDLIEASVKIETIAGWMRVTRKAMNNIPGFISFLQARLPEKLLRIEDTQLIQGNGTSPNLKGILVSGNYTAATSTSNLLVEQIIDGLAQLEDTLDRTSTGVIIRPGPLYKLLKTKASGSKEYDLPPNLAYVNGQLFVSGVPLYASTGMQSGKYLIGDFAMGCQLLTQESIRLEFFEEDGTNVRENKVTVRIEETVAFPVYGSTYFVGGDIGAASLTA